MNTTPLAQTIVSLRTEIGPLTDRDHLWQPMVSAGEIRQLLDALDGAAAREREAAERVAHALVSGGYSKGAIDEAFAAGKREGAREVRERVEAVLAHRWYSHATVGAAVRAVLHAARTAGGETPVGGHSEARSDRDAPISEAATVPPTGPRCPDHPDAAVVRIDPTGGDPFMGGPVLIEVCHQCGRQCFAAGGEPE